MNDEIILREFDLLVFEGFQVGFPVGLSDRAFMARLHLEVHPVND